MYELKEATCDCCATVYRAVTKKHYCPHCDKYYYVCNRCFKQLAHCPDCGVQLIRKTPPLKMIKDELGIKESLRIMNQRKERYFST